MKAYWVAIRLLVQPYLLYEKMAESSEQVVLRLESHLYLSRVRILSIRDQSMILWSNGCHNYIGTY